MTVADDNENYQHEVIRKIRAAVGSGASDFIAILRNCEGADPVLVQELYKREFPDPPRGISRSLNSLDPADPRLSLRLPVPDPARSQWWFTSSSIEFLSKRIETSASLFDSPSILCLGAPSISHYLAHRGNTVHVLDVDPDVIQALDSIPEGCTTTTYDAADPLPLSLVGQACIAVIDPPWYEAALRTFLCRALEGVKIGGEIILTLPPRLTRPGIEKARAALIDDLLKNNRFSENSGAKPHIL